MPEQDYRDAAKHFISKTCVPLAIEKDDHPSAILQGSGTFFNFDGALFFVTAEHVFDNIDINKIGIPISLGVKDIVKVIVEPDGRKIPITDCTVRTFGKFKLYRNSESDVAIIHILEKELVSLFKESYDFLDYSYLAQPNNNDNIIVTGYSTHLGESVAGRLTFPIFTYETTLIPPPPNEQYLEGVDCFMPYYELEKVGGGDVEPFMLNGISGGPIWQVVQLPRDNIWTPHSAMKMIGIEKSVKRNHFIRGTFIKHLATLFEQIDPDIATKMNNALNN